MAANPTGRFSNAVKGNFIEGKFETPSQPTGAIESLCPGDLSDRIGTFSFSQQSVEQAVQSAEKAFSPWRALRLEQRTNFLKDYQAALKAREEELAEYIAREVGKPLWEAKTEAKAMVGKVDISIADGMAVISDIELPNLMAGTNGYCRHKPLGVVAVIGPFNFPGHLPNGHIVPALLSGNTVIFKPSEKTPMVGQIMAECFEQANFPSGVFNLVQGEANISSALCTHSSVRGVFFTGSYDVGLRIKRATLDQPQKLLALEMGGKNSAIVWEDADLDRALFETLTGAYLTSGQRCSATSKIILHKSVRDAFVEKFCQATQSIQVGHPLTECFMGPLIDGKSVDRFVEAAKSFQSSGMTQLVAGERLKLDTEGHYVSASVFSCSENSTESIRSVPYLQNEVFGPSVVIFETDDLDQAITIANATDFGLVNSIFTTNKAIYEKCWEKLDSGLINWNKSTVGASSKLPFGGIKKSGNHFPTALYAGRYCTVPVTSMEMEKSSPVAAKIPGITLG